jgi:hypothetical protein
MLKDVILSVVSKEFIFLSKSVAKVEIITEIDNILTVFFRSIIMNSTINTSSLNEKQQEAVVSRDKRLLVLAGAGSGKTMTLLLTEKDKNSLRLEYQSKRNRF